MVLRDYLNVGVAADQELQARFRKLVESYAAPVRRLCLVYAQNASDRDDLFQEILLAVWRALPSFRGDASERTWLYRIAHNVALTFQTKSRRTKSREESLDESVRDPRECVNVRRMALFELISQLRPVDRHLVILHLEGLSGCEMEEITGIRRGTVAVRLARIRQQLAAAIQGLEVTP